MITCYNALFTSLIFIAFVYFDNFNLLSLVHISKVTQYLFDPFLWLITTIVPLEWIFLLYFTRTVNQITDIIKFNVNSSLKLCLDSFICEGVLKFLHDETVISIMHSLMQWLFMPLGNIILRGYIYVYKTCT